MVTVAEALPKKLEQKKRNRDSYVHIIFVMHVRIPTHCVGIETAAVHVQQSTRIQMHRRRRHLGSCIIVPAVCAGEDIDDIIII